CAPSSLLPAEPHGASRIEPDVLAALDASADGRAYVVVALKEPFLPSGAGWEARRAAIRGQEAAALAGISSDDAQVAYRYSNFARLTGWVTRAALAKLAASAVVEAVGADRVARLQGISAAGFLGATQAHEFYGVTGKGFAVTLLDSGVSSTHPDLAEDILPAAWTFLDAGATSHAGAEDDFGHG